ncbi:Inorganic phosphate transporter pho84 [Geranomyces variabilis]|uniref:Inorganic phosphate transporter pho84 n=1 Tax=Geranomyces variabilis TaxID=109894 RepID=A0AAD5XUI2_9FUNG|nr:Inorganic phosphate transporter pho84 [Geranomyces variabilis]
MAPRATRASALAQLDSAVIGNFHMKAIAVAGVGFYTDAYDLFAINLALPMIYLTYMGTTNVNSWLDGSIKGIANVGNAVGQLLFGYLADRLGRKRMYGVELMLMIVATLGQALTAPPAKGVGILAILAFWRFCVGVGIGGDYPLSAIITSEFASVERRGKMMAAVFACQGIGQLSAVLITVITLACFKGAIQDDPQNLDYCWRIILGLGIVPALCALYFRLTIPETPRFTAHITGDENAAAKDIEKIMLQYGGKAHNNNAAPTMTAVSPAPDTPRSHVSQATINTARPTSQRKGGLRDFNRTFLHGGRRNLQILIATSMTWFCLDVAFYGLNLNTSVVISAIGFGGKKTPWDQVWSAALGNLIVVFCGNLPGYFAAILLIERIGRKKLQYMGFIVGAVLLLVLAASYHKLLASSVAGFVVLYSLLQFFFNCGANTTTFVVPGECYPTRFRSTAHGISAAAGKLGAILTTFGIAPIRNNGGTNESMNVVLYIFAAFMAVGALFTAWIPETKGKTLEQLADEFEGIEDLSEGEGEGDEGIGHEDLDQVVVDRH